MGDELKLSSATGQETTVPPASPEPGSEWTIRNTVLATLMAVGVGVLFLLIYRFHMVVFLFFVAITLAIVIRPAINRLQALGVPPRIGVILVFLLLVAFVGTSIWFVTPILSSQLTTTAQELPESYRDLRSGLADSSNALLRALGRVLPLTLFQAADPAETAPEVADEAGTPAWEWAAQIGKAFLAAMAILMLVYYWTLEGNIIVRRLLLRVRRERREELRGLIDETEAKIAGYFRSQALLSVIIAVVSSAAYLLIGIPNAVVLGLIMGLFEVLPVIGPFLGAIPAVLMTLVVAPDKVLWVIGATVLIQALEGNLLVPRMMDESIGVNPIVSILAIVAFGLLFGLPGAILAIPLAAVLQILLNRFLFEVPPGEPVAGELVESNSKKRDRISVLRLEAQKLAQDLRKQKRNGDEEIAVHGEVEQTEDLLEAIALDLDSLLVQMEGTR